MPIKPPRYSILLPGIFIFVMAGSLAEAAQLTWNGFASFYGQKSFTSDVYDLGLPQDKTDFSNGTKVGLNLRADFADNWSLIGQLLAAQRTLGFNNNSPPIWGPEYDWVYLNYDPTNEINVRVGRQIFPGSLTAEYTDVGLALPWRRLPIQFYTLVQFKSFEGISGAYQLKLGADTLSIRLFGGDSRPDQEDGLNFVYQINDLSGFTLSFEGNGWRVQATAAQFYYVPIIPSPGITLQTNLGKYIEAGGKYDKNNIVAYLEYIDSECGTGSTVCYGRGYYGTLGYRLGNFMPNFTYAYAENNFNTGFVELTSNIAGVNFQLNPSMVLKAEYLMEQGLNNATPGGINYISASGVARSVSVGLDLVF